MKIVILFCFFLICLTSAVYAQYSDASLDGPWILVISGVEVYDYTVYLLFDGEGKITGMGSFNTPDSAGSYTVDPGGAISGYIWSDGYQPFTGQMQTDSTAVFYFDPLTLPLLKVMDLGACSGDWQGSFVQDVTNVTYSVEMTINEFGEIETCTGFSPPVTGLFFYQSGYIAGLFSTGETEPGWEEVKPLDAGLTGDTMSGTFAVDCNDCEHGTFELVLIPPMDAVPDANPLFTLKQNHPNPFNPRTVIPFTLHERAHVNLSVYDVMGRFIGIIFDGTLPEGPATVEWNGKDSTGIPMSSGVYFYGLRSNGKMSTKKMILLR